MSEVFLGVYQGCFKHWVQASVETVSVLLLPVFNTRQ